MRVPASDQTISTLTSQLKLDLKKDRSELESWHDSTKVDNWANIGKNLFPSLAVNRLRENWSVEISRIKSMDEVSINNLVSKNVRGDDTSFYNLVSSIIYNEIVRPHEKIVEDLVRDCGEGLDSELSGDEQYDRACLIASWFMNYGFGYRSLGGNSPKETREWLQEKQEIPIINTITRKFNVGERRKRKGCCVGVCGTCGGTKKQIEIFYQKGREPSFLKSHYLENQSLE